MKKKFLILTLCFTLLFSSINYKKSYADGGLLSLPMLGVVSSLAVGSGIILNSDDDLFDIGRIFYDYIDRHNSLTWETVNAAFASVSVLQPSNLISVKSDFLDIVKGFFDDTFFNKGNDYPFVGSFDSIPFYPKYITVGEGDTFDCISIIKEGSKLYILINGSKYDFFTSSSGNFNSLHLTYNRTSKQYTLVAGVNGVAKYSYNVTHLVSSGLVSFPYTGGYAWDDVESKKENGNISLPIPGNLGSLVGQNKDTFWGNTDNLVGTGGLTLPGVSNPSIGVDSSVNTFPSVDTNVPDVPGVDSPSVPNDGIWATIKDFIIGLVVPSDAFWTDTWGGLYNNFINSFPMVDMDGFNDLVTGEKKFPNIDVNIMGVTGRVVNGDVINSIVDWLRPIIAGFMMLCLMLFNYRKIYKLIRNTEPFGGIAPGTSDFSTGISEYNKEPVIKAVDMSAEYRSWKENGGK